MWDYPRPPRVEATARHVVVWLGGEIIAETRHALRVLETASPPTYYVPLADVRPGVLTPETHTTFCEFKGLARYHTVSGGDRRAAAAAWWYPEPAARYARLRDHVAFHAGRLDACWVDGERVRPQEGDYYGGWITADLVGPFKGAPGTEAW